jgi:cytidyltransferase-like protein
MIFYHADEFVRYVDATEQCIIGITSGCFDLLHPLHVEYLNKCKRECFHELFVFIDSDRLVKEHKNKTPLINEMDRAYMVDNLKAVSGVMVINTLVEMSDCIRRIATPNNRYITIFKHSDRVYGAKLFEYGPKVENVIIPDVKRFHSTTEIQEHLKKENA